MFLDTLLHAALEDCHLKKEETLVIGVSGGADSLALLYGLHDGGFNLVVAHLDHAIRPGSSQEAAFVARTAETLGVPFFQTRVDVLMVAEQTGQSLEEAARNVRYRFLMEQARKHRAQAVAVAHHADDQVETILMHFLRGAAMSGLTGMAFRRVIPMYDPQIPLARPLLGIWRSEIEAYIKEIGVSACIDESNADITYFRNRLRHQLIPDFETYNPKFRLVLLRMAEILRREDELLDEFTTAAWDQCQVSQSEDRIILLASEFKQLQKALQRRLLRRAVSILRPDLRDVGFEAIERGINFVLSPSEHKQIDLVARLNLALVKEYLILKTWSAELPRWDMPLLPSADFLAHLDVGGSIHLDAGWVLQAELLESMPVDALVRVRELGSNQSWLDFDRLQMPLTIRGKETGDTWQPLGMEGHSQKISDFFVNKKTPEHLRLIWPLVFSGGNVAWVVGMRPAELFKVTSTTKRILALKLLSDPKIINEEFQG